MKTPIIAETARATTGILGQRLWGDIDLNNISPDNMSSTLDVWEKDLKENYKNVVLDDVLTEDKYIKYDLLANFAKDEGVPLDAKVNLSAKGTVKELKYGKKRFRADGPKLYMK